MRCKIMHRIENTSQFKQGLFYTGTVIWWLERLKLVLHRLGYGYLLSLLPQAFLLGATIIKPDLYSGFTDAQSLDYLLADERVWVV